MNLLILGGTRFLGRAIAEAALSRGHQLTLFHRGQTNPALFDDAEHVTGDRDGALESLAGQTWDACIDTCGYVPRIVRQSADLLSGAVDRYAFVSTLSVYANPTPQGTDESGELGSMDDPTMEEITGETYGPLKALCEAEVQREFGDRALIVRPGLIVGRHDASDRFTSWPWRIAQGGDVLAPGRPDRTIQLIDVRDLAEWIVAMIEDGTTGVFNAVSPPDRLTMGQMLDTCISVSGSDAKLHWADDEWLTAREVGPWMEMPLWIPEGDPLAEGFFSFRSDRAMDAGLRFRSLEDTVSDTLAWLNTEPKDRPWRAGMDRDREATLLRELTEI